MLHFRPGLPLVLSSLYFLCSQVQAQSPPACAVQCGTTAAAASGCDPCVPHFILTAGTRISKLTTRSFAELIRHAFAPVQLSYNLRLLAWRRPVMPLMPKRQRTILPRCAPVPRRQDLVIFCSFNHEPVG
jgi:hypothetical protein